MQNAHLLAAALAQGNGLPQLSLAAHGTGLDAASLLQLQILQNGGLGLSLGGPLPTFDEQPVKESAGTRGRAKSTDSRSSSAYASRHQAAEARRRTRINERLDLLRKIVPHAERANTACFLEEVIKYIESLKRRNQELEQQVLLYRTLAPQQAMSNKPAGGAASGSGSEQGDPKPAPGSQGAAGTAAGSNGLLAALATVKMDAPSNVSSLLEHALLANNQPGGGGTVSHASLSMMAPPLPLLLNATGNGAAGMLRGSQAPASSANSGDGRDKAAPAPEYGSTLPPELRKLLNEVSPSTPPPVPGLQAVPSDLTGLSGQQLAANATAFFAAAAAAAAAHQAAGVTAGSDAAALAAAMAAAGAAPLAGGAAAGDAAEAAPRPSDSGAAAGDSGTSDNAEAGLPYKKRRMPTP